MTLPRESIPTPRLTLTPLTVADAPGMLPVLADPGLYTFIGGSPPTLAELRARYERQTAGPDWHNWIVRSGGAPVGTVQATVSTSSTEIAWMLGKPWQGMGYAAEAVCALVGWLLDQGVTRIVAHVHPSHAASAAVARAAGFTPTGTFVDGERLWVLAPAPNRSPRGETS